MNLVAKFRYILTGKYLFVCKDLFEEISFHIKIEEFSVCVDLNPNRSPEMIPSTLEPGHEQYYGLNEIIIGVSRYEEQLEKLDNASDVLGIQNLIQSVREDYVSVAVRILNNLFSYFKYILNNPRLVLVSEHDSQLQMPDWFNESGKHYPINCLIAIVELLPRISVFGLNCYTDKNHDDLEKSLLGQTQVSLFEELLSDAQTAVFENNVRRAALELAIATEVLIKNYFFQQYTTASDVYEYLFDKEKIRISVIELIDGVAKKALGESFKEHNKKAYDDIDNLFRCRNKIAHHGKAQFSGNSGVVYEVTPDVLKEWWDAVRLLNEWLICKPLH